MLADVLTAARSCEKIGYIFYISDFKRYSSGI